MVKKKKTNLHHFHVRGCKAEVRIYNPKIKKLDPKTISDYFFGYCIGYRGSRFFCPSTTRIVELDKAVYFVNDFGFDSSNGPREPQFREESVFIPSIFFLIEMLLIYWLMNRLLVRMILLLMSRLF